MRRGPWCSQVLRVLRLLVTVAVLGGLWTCAKPIKLEAPQPAPGGVTFTVLAPSAKQVVLVGSFNAWSKTTTPMMRVNGALWSVVVPLKQGEYSFMYVIDDVQWLTPPQADDFVMDGFGQTNGVVVVR